MRHGGFIELQSYRVLKYALLYGWVCRRLKNLSPAFLIFSKSIHIPDYGFMNAEPERLSSDSKITESFLAFN